MIAKDVDTDGDNDIDRGERYAYDEQGGLEPVLLVFDDTGALLRRTLHGQSVDKVFASETDSGDVFWMLPDHLGSVRDVAEFHAVCGETEVVNHIQYSAFGTSPAVSLQGGSDHSTSRSSTKFDPRRISAGCS